MIRPDRLTVKAGEAVQGALALYRKMVGEFSSHRHPIDPKVINEASNIDTARAIGGPIAPIPRGWGVLMLRYDQLSGFGC